MLWRVVAQQETTKDGWSGSRQVPTFYVDGHGLASATENAISVLTEGRELAGPLHLSLTKTDRTSPHTDGDGRVYQVSVIRESDAIPPGTEVVHKRLTVV